MIKTKQELLNHFTDINAMYNNPFMYQTLSNMIDELLEQQPCEDAVSRETAKSAIREKFKDLPTRCEINEVLNSLPSVTPQRKRGKWIKIGKDSRGYTDTFECSECGEMIRFMSYMDDCEYDYCPYCLADMRGDTDE